MNYRFFNYLEKIMLKKHLLALVALTITGLMPVAHATDQTQKVVDKRFYVAPFGTYMRSAGARGTTDGWGGGLGFGKMLNEHFNVELRGFFIRAQGYTDPLAGTNSGSWNFTGGTVDAQYYFFRKAFSPYTVLALGGMNTSVPGGSAAGFIGQLGVGFTYEVMSNFLVRSDVRYQYNNNSGTSLRPYTSSDFNDMLVNVGFVVPFGPKPKAPEIVPPPPVEAAVDCSTLDSDGDGVNDCNDKCFGTINGTKVDIAGCPIVLVLNGVNFKFDSAELTENAMLTLDDVAKGLTTFPLKDDIEVRGYTSSEEIVRGHNQALSERRSQSVADYLKMKGVTNRLIARGFGASNPVADNSTEAGRIQNRRVELRWMDHQGSSSN
jgi:OOP family OmpA-OmpF porin